MSGAATVYQTLNLVAITCAALAGSTAARRRGLDAVGVLSCAVITGLGGGLLRDVLLQDGIPASIANPWNPAAAFAAGAVLCFTSPRGAAWRVIAPVAEAATIGAWTVTGTEKAAALGVAPISAILLGMLSSVGGGAIRDVVVLRRVPQIFGGTTLTATCAVASAVVMIVAYRLQHPEAGLIGGTAIGGVLYLVARWRHWVLPPVERQGAETPGAAPLGPAGVTTVRSEKSKELCRTDRGNSTASADSASRGKKHDRELTARAAAARPAADGGPRSTPSRAPRPRPARHTARPDRPAHPSAPYRHPPRGPARRETPSASSRRTGHGPGSGTPAARTHAGPSPAPRV
jgi:uncharacterized membrane protein YeiH